MTIIEELKEIGAMIGIKPVGNNILEIVKSMKQQLETKKVPVSNEIKTFVKEEEQKEAKSKEEPQETFKETAPAEEAITESAPEEKPVKRSKKKADKETTVKFTAE